MCRNLVTHKVEWTRDVLEKAQNILTLSLCQLIRFTIHTQTMTHKGPWDEITWNTSIQLCLAPLQSRVCEPFFPSCSSHRLHIPGTVRAVYCSCVQLHCLLHTYNCVLIIAVLQDTYCSRPFPSLLLVICSFLVSFYRVLNCTVRIFYLSKKQKG